MSINLGSLINDLSKSSEKIEEKLLEKRSCSTWRGKKTETIEELCENHVRVHRLFEHALRSILEQEGINFQEDINISDVVETRRQSLEAVQHIIQKKVVHSTTLLQNLRSIIHPDSPLLNRTQDKFIEKHHHEWHLNTALLLDVYKNTTDLALKKQIEFLILNYLTKSATVGVKWDGWGDQEVAQQLQEISQVGAFDELTHRQYHRESSTYEKIILPEVLHDLALERKNIDKVYLLDTENVDFLFPVSFSVLPAQNGQHHEIDACQKKFEEAFQRHLSKYGDTVFSNYIDPPLVLDITERVKQYVNGNPSSENKAQLYAEINKIKENVELAAEKAAQTLSVNPQEQQEIKALLMLNTNFICRATSRQVGLLIQVNIFLEDDFYRLLSIESGIKLNMRESGVGYTRRQEHFRGKIEDFVNRTGIRLGGVRSRALFTNFLSLERILERTGKKSQLAEYAVLPGDPTKIPLAVKETVLKTNLFRQFKQLMKNEMLEESFPHYAILGNATTNLLEGLLNEIGEDKWKLLNEDLNTRMLLTTSLSRIMNHLAAANAQAFAASQITRKEAAEFPPQQSFNEFSQAIELIHCEIATILALTSPFNEADFESIYTNQLQFIPEELRENVKAGVTKSAMNTVAGINRAVISKDPEAVRTYMEGSYFESRLLMGDQRAHGSVIEDANVTSVGLYVREFNENISVHMTHSHYTAANLIPEIDQLLTSKPNANGLTIGIDSTIDNVNSPKAQALLQHYEREIKDGKLNFVFFRSGQKFDMLGMDNYYGSPFYMVNNGEIKWKAFDELQTNPAHTTDPLSMQWFCLANKYAFEDMDNYRTRIFRNHRTLLDQIEQDIPELLPRDDPTQKIKVSTADNAVDSAFIAIKIYGNRPQDIIEQVEKIYHQEFLKEGALVYSRGSFGFSSPNINNLGSWESQGRDICIVRLNLGLDPRDIQIMKDVLKKVSESS